MALMVAGWLGCDDGPDLPSPSLATIPPVTVYGDMASVCKGTLVEISAHVRSVNADLSEVESFSEKVELLVTPDASGLCDSGAGCTMTERHPILAIAEVGSIQHELAHAVQKIRTGVLPPPWLLEGFAEAWSGRGGLMPKYPSALDLAAETSWDVDYSGARHLVRWIRSRLSRSEFAALFSESRGEDLVGHIERALDNAWPELQHEFWESAPLYDPGPVDCASVSMAVTPTRPAAVQGVFDCDDDSTRGVVFSDVPPRFGVSVILDVEAEASYRMQVIGGIATLLPCDPVDDPVEAAFWGHVEEARELPPPLSSASSDKVYTLKEGRYRAEVTSGVAGPFTLTLHPNYRVSRHALVE